MLREILLSLSGIPSPIWDDLNENETTGDARDDSSLAAYTTPAERQMVQTLADLANLHIKVRDAATSIVSSHPSPICRAVSNRVKSFHLRAFRKKVIEVESLILQEDAKYVGAYKIVPLSTIVTEFSSWKRPLAVLRKITQLLQSEKPICTGARVLGVLSKECHTGYTDVAELASDLLVSAQQAWTQSLTPWLLYGQLPPFGADDFLVHSAQDTDVIDYRLVHDLVPSFVSGEAAEIILSIGKSLNQIKSRSVQNTGFKGDVCTSLMPAALAQIKSLSYPLQANAVKNTAAAINDAIAQTALSHLLPRDMVLEFLQVIQDYVLLGKGEFSASLISQGESWLQVHQSTVTSAQSVRKLGRVDVLRINNFDIAAILSKTWSDLSTFLPDDEYEDSLREKASMLLQLKANPSVPISNLLPTPTSLVIDLPHSSSLNIFVTQSDLQRYCHLNAYIISMRRGEVQLTKLWKITGQRRCHPAPLRPARTSALQGQGIWERRRARDHRRQVKLRTHWACASQVLLLLSEMGDYFHGEVIQRSWTQLTAWLDRGTANRPSSSRLSSRPTTASSTGMTSVSAAINLELQTFSTNDPRALAQAHQRYLEALYHSLLLSNKDYISILKELLTTIDHFVALFQRMQILWQGLDLQQDEGITDAFSDYAQEEKEVMVEMARANANLTEQVQELVGAIREAEKHRDLSDLTTATTSMGLGTSRDPDAFEPWRARTLDRLLMKLDSLALNEADEAFEDALVDAEHD